MKPLQLSPETAIKLSKKLNVPIEQLMHMPQHILIQKLWNWKKKKNNITSVICIAVLSTNFIDFYKLVDKKLLIPASRIKRVRTYRLGDQVKHPS